MSFPSSREHGDPARGENGERSTRFRHSQPNIHDLSFILHPSHEVSRPENDQSSPSAGNVDSEEPIAIARACGVLRVSQALMDHM